MRRKEGDASKMKFYCPLDPPSLPPSLTHSLRRPPPSVRPCVRQRPPAQAYYRQEEIHPIRAANRSLRVRGKVGPRKSVYSRGLCQVPNRRVLFLSFKWRPQIGHRTAAQRSEWFQ